MPRSKDPQTFGDIFADLLIRMHEKFPKLEIKSTNPAHLRLEFYAYRRAWSAQMEKFFKRKDQQNYELAKANYDALARYRCYTVGPSVFFEHQSQITGEIITYGEPVSEGAAANLLDNPPDVPGLAEALEKLRTGAAENPVETLYKPSETPPVESDIMQCSACGQEHSVFFECDPIKDAKAKRAAEDQLLAEWRLARAKGETKNFHDWIEARAAMSLDHLAGPAALKSS